MHVVFGHYHVEINKYVKNKIIIILYRSSQNEKKATLNLFRFIYIILYTW